MTALMCPKCEREVLPGSPVDVIGPDPREHPIMLSDEVIVSHVECPKGREADADRDK